jgi:hypothetical protein
MGIFDFWKKKDKPINFSEKNITELTKQSDALGEILIQNGMPFRAEYLSLIIEAAKNNDEVEFKKLIISRDLFGGSGALWEIYIENQTEYYKFNKAFRNYIDLITLMGIKNGRVEQIQKIMPKLI